MIPSFHRTLPTRGACALTLTLALALGCRHFQNSWAPSGRDSDSQALVDGALEPDSPAAKATTAAEPAANKSGANANAGSTPKSSDGAAAPNPADKAAQASVQPAAASAAAATPAAAASPIDDATRAALAKDAWWVNDTKVGVCLPDESGWRFRSPPLDELLRTPADERPRLDELIDSKNSVLAANAAIVQIRWRQAEPVARLTTTIRNSELRLPLRLAAVEALAGIEPEKGRQAVEELLKRFGEFKGSKAVQYVPLLHVELLVALARIDAAAATPYWIAALKSPDVKAQLLALDALAASDVDLPPAVAALRDVNDPRLRAASLRTLAKRHDPKALEYLKYALNDLDLSVRLAAVAGLADIRTPQSLAALEKMMLSTGEMVRAGAVESLAILDADEAVSGAAQDKSSRVRQTVANSLARADGMVARRPNEATRIITTMLSDRAPDVQQAAVAALAEWPLQQAGPILLAAMDEKGYLVRKTAALQLGQRWEPASDFPADSPADRRSAALDALRAAWASQFGLLASAVAPRAPTEAPAATLRRIESQWRDVVSRAKFEEGVNSLAWMREAMGKEESARQASLAAPASGVEEARSLVAALSAPSVAKRDSDAAIEGLKSLGAAVLPVLDEIALADSRPLPEAIYTEVLPPIQPVFAMLLEIQTAKPGDRWSGADRLAAYVAKKPLPALALARLAGIMARMSDTLVWQSVLAALLYDSREPADRIAAMAIEHDSPEVRRRAAEYFAHNRSPKHAALLMPLLEDSQLTVVLAAVTALAESGPLDNPAPLVALLKRGEAPLRLATALTLARLDLPEGRPALERLANDVDADVRRGAALAMGTLEDESYAPLLIRLLEDRHDVAVAAMKALVKIAGRDVAAEPADDAPASDAERIRRWQQWQRERESPPGSAARS